MADEKALVKLIADLIENTPKVSTIKKLDLPSDARKTLEGWVADKNVPVDNSDTSADTYSITNTEVPDTYVADYEGDDPDPFRLVVVIQSGKVIGESIDVAS